MPEKLLACNCRFERAIIIIAIIITATTAKRLAVDMQHDEGCKTVEQTGKLAMPSPIPFYPFVRRLSWFHLCVHKRLKIASLFVQGIKGFGRGT